MALNRQDYGEKTCRFGRLIQLPEQGFKRPLPAAQSEASAVSAVPVKLIQAADHLAVRRHKCPADFLYFAGAEPQDHDVVRFREPVGARQTFSSRLKRRWSGNWKCHFFVKMRQPAPRLAGTFAAAGNSALTRSINHRRWTIARRRLLGQHPQSRDQLLHFR